MEVWAARLERLSDGGMHPGDVFHPRGPRSPPVPPGPAELAQRALHRAWRFLAAEMAKAVCLPLLFVRRYVRAAQEPEGAFVERVSVLGLAALEHAIYFFEQRHACELACEAGANGSLGGGRIRIVVERGRVCDGRVGLVKTGGRHRGTAGERSGMGEG